MLGRRLGSHKTEDENYHCMDMIAPASISTRCGDTMLRAKAREHEKVEILLVVDGVSSSSLTAKENTLTTQLHRPLSFFLLPTLYRYVGR